MSQSSSSNSISLECAEALEIARDLFEKCALLRSKNAYLKALRLAREAGDLASVAQCLSGLLRLAAEAKDSEEIARWDRELSAIDAPTTALAMVWYCRGVVAAYQHQDRQARTHFLRALKISNQVLAERPDDEACLEENLKIWGNLVNDFADAGRIGRALFVADAILARYEKRAIKGVNGAMFMIHGLIAEGQGDADAALVWYQKAHGAYLAERNWFAHIYVLYAYARIARIQRVYTQAYWYLDLMDKASNGPEFGNLQSIVARERQRLEDDAIDLLVDSRACSVNTREAKGLPLGKQYVLLGILEALTEAHGKNEPDSERGLSKAEIIERVWREKYRPEAHDNKLYYNINRLRKLIEPDMKHPKYLLNWKEGYRLSPGMKVHYVGGKSKGGSIL